MVQHAMLYFPSQGILHVLDHMVHVQTYIFTNIGLYILFHNLLHLRIYQQQIFTAVYITSLYFFYPRPRACLLIPERREEREGNIHARETRPSWEQTHNVGMCPDWESNLQPFGLWDDAPTN